MKFDDQNEWRIVVQEDHSESQIAFITKYVSQLTERLQTLPGYATRWR